MDNKKKRKKYLISFIILMILEVFIALYVNDNFVRPYMGDVLVVILVYSFVKIFIPDRFKKLMPFLVFLFAVIVEFMQYLKIVEILGLQHNIFARVIIGTSYDIKDILCYFIGMLLIYVTEIFLNLKNNRL